MPVDKEHSEYGANKDKWGRCRDCLNGQDAVHAAGTKYLPKLKEQPDEDYNAYVARALFFNATQRTCEGLVGMVFRKPPQHEVPAAAKSLLEDVTLTGQDIVQFSQACLTETIGLGRVGILVDYPVIERQPATVKEAEVSGARPFMVMYEAESIINWQQERIGGTLVTTLVVLKEFGEEKEDAFTVKKVDQLRALRLLNGSYTVELYRKEGNGSEWKLWKSSVPLMQNKPLPFIPFVIVGARTVSATVEKPPLLDMVNVNLSHYRTTADYEHGAHFCGLPTAVVSGYRPEDNSKPLYIGAAAAWIFPQPEARASYLEFTGQGLGALKDLKAEKEAAMAALGARMLAPEKRDAEAAETAAIHRSGEVSVLATIAQTLARGIEQALKWLCEWNGQPVEDAEFKLNTDYFPMPIDSATMTALVSAWQQGAISKETLFYNLKRGEIVPEDTTLEDEEAAIGDEPPVLANQLTQIEAQGQQRGMNGNQQGQGVKAQAE